MTSKSLGQIAFEGYFESDSAYAAYAWEAANFQSQWEKAAQAVVNALPTTYICTYGKHHENCPWDKGPRDTGSADDEFPLPCERI